MRRRVKGTPTARTCSSVAQWSRPKVKVPSGVVPTKER